MAIKKSKSIFSIILHEHSAITAAIKILLKAIVAVTSHKRGTRNKLWSDIDVVFTTIPHSPMHKAKETTKKFLNPEEKTSQLFAQSERMKELSKSLGDLPNFKKEIDAKLKGKLPKSSPRLLGIRRLGETKISVEIDEVETSVVTRDCFCVLHPKMKGDGSSEAAISASFTPPLSRNDQLIRDIARENTNSTSLSTMRQKTLKVDDIVHTASKLEAEYLKRAKSPVYLRNCTHRGPYGNCSVCQGICYSEKSKPSSRLKTRTLVVKIPGISDNLNDYNCKGGPRSARSNFSYRHKK